MKREKRLPFPPILRQRFSLDDEALVDTRLGAQLKPAAVLFCPLSA